MKDEQTGLLRQLRFEPFKWNPEKKLLSILSDLSNPVLFEQGKINTRVGNNLWIRSEPGENIGECFRGAMELRKIHPEL